MPFFMAPICCPSLAQSLKKAANSISLRYQVKLILSPKQRASWVEPVFREIFRQNGISFRGANCGENGTFFREAKNGEKCTFRGAKCGEKWSSFGL
jgi:hypothetical protein